MKILNIEKAIKPKFTRINQVNYKENNVNKKWEYVESLNSVHILVFNADTNKFLLVKQLRIPVLMNQKGHNGYIIECCAGLVDKELSLIEIAKEEILEELGYKTSNINFKDNLLSSVGLIGQNMSLFTSIVYNKDIINKGGGINNENIEIVEISIDDLFTLPNIDLVTAHMINTYARELV